MLSNTNLAERLQAAKKQIGLTQGKLAMSLGISQGHLSDLEAGRKVPSDTLLIALAYRWEISLHWLLTGEGSMTDTSPMILDKVAEGMAPYGPEISKQIERVKYIYQHGSDVQKDQLYACIGRVYDGILSNKRGTGDTDSNPDGRFPTEGTSAQVQRQRKKQKPA